MYMDARNNISPEFESKANLKAKKAVEIVGPHVYRIHHPNPNEKITRFFVLGCHGTGEQDQVNTAKLMNDIASLSADHKPSFILFLGDNVYDYGTQAPDDDQFNTCHHNIYDDRTLPIIAITPKFMILGNHDENFSAKPKLAFNANKSWFGIPLSIQGRDIGINEVAHTYLGHTKKKIGLFTKDNLDPQSLSSWVMPYYYYSIITGNTQIFCIDSNTYAKDYLELRQGTAKPRNQAAWLATEYENARAASRQVMIALHHPLYTAGKRAFPEKYDSKHYLTDAEIQDLNVFLGTQTYSYNQLLSGILERQEIDFDLVLPAHDHLIQYLNNAENADTPLRQFTCGGGGGKLQARERFEQHPYVGCHFQHHGFGMITCDADKPGYLLDIHTSEGHHLRFNEKNHRPLCLPGQDSQAEQLRNAIHPVCDDYLDDLKKNEKPIRENYKESSWVSAIKVGLTMYADYMHHDHAKTQNIKAVHDILGYLDQHEPLDYDTLWARLVHVMASLPDKETEGSLYNLIERAIAEQNEMTHTMTI